MKFYIPYVCFSEALKALDVYFLSHEGIGMMFDGYNIYYLTSSFGFFNVVFCFIVVLIFMFVTFF